MIVPSQLFLPHLHQRSPSASKQLHPLLHLLIITSQFVIPFPPVRINYVKFISYYVF